MAESEAMGDDIHSIVDKRTNLSRRTSIDRRLLFGIVK